MKAFLSHSSIDKEFVREVANKLGRLQCIFDERSFNAGDKFEVAIQEHLDNSSVFIFFATRASLESFWCDFEINQAFYAQLKSKISKSVVYVVGDGISIDLLPSWLKTSLIVNEKSPAVIARDIKHQLDKQAEDFQRPVFLGRALERESLEECLNPFDGSKSPKVISVFGLPGVGRRALIKSSIKDLYSLSKYVEIEIDSGDTANAVCAKLADIIEPYSCQAELKDIVNEIMELPESEAINRAVKNINAIVRSGELPVFIDLGGAVKNNGCLQNFLNEMIDGIDQSDDAYLVLVLTRRISKENAKEINSIVVEQLSNKSTYQLISSLSRRANLPIEAEYIRELTEYISGYPPAASFAIKQASIYGIEALMNDKGKLTQFSQKRFINHIRDHDLQPSDVKVLQALAGYSPLPLSALIALYEGSNVVAHDRIYDMIDCSLIRVQGGQLYKIADPIKGSVNSVFGYADSEDLKTILVHLVTYIANAEEEKKLELSRVLFRLGYYLDDPKATESGIKLSSDYIKMLENAYHQRKYKDAIKLGFEALKYNPADATARTFLIKALVQDERWEAAQKQINDLYPVDDYKNVYFLQGFLERKRGNIKDAIKAYKESEKHKRKGFALLRELSHCYLMNGDLDLSNTYITEALKIQPNNDQVIDMAAKVSIKRGDEAKAKEYIDRLELLDTPEHYNLRLSVFHMTFNRNEQALSAAKEAVKNGGERFFSGRVQLIKSLTKCKKLNDAEEEMSALNTDFSKTKNDVRLSLASMLSLEKGDARTALSLTDQFLDKHCIQYYGIRKSCLTTLITDPTIKYNIRKQYKEDLNALDPYTFGMGDVDS